ncbi:hypothetical protein [Nocardioides plantarum]|uniref:Uncharacterized protein n=1 Tax=Nocardioides plantarum TaxID=29299 RepID=A0ABV5K7D3_9ACTN|nr:hypothetical protein [Nocardioides plantarum]
MTRDDEDDEELDGVDIPPEQFVEAEVPTTDSRDAQQCLKEKYKGDRNVYSIIGTSYPAGYTTSWMAHSQGSSNETEYGVAIGVETSGGSGFDYKASGTRTVGGSWTGTWDPLKVARSYQIQVNYHYYVLGEGCKGETRYQRPHVETGGAQDNTSGLVRPGWKKYCANQPRNYQFDRTDDRGKAYSYGAAVKFAKIIGINLSVKKAYTKSNRLSYKFAGSAKHSLCGYDEYPALAGKMVDRPYWVE